MATAGEMFDPPFWIQFGFLALLAGFSPLGFLVGIPIAFGLTVGTRWAAATFAKRSLGALFAAGEIKRQPEFSIQESMIARGRFDEAVASFRAHLTSAPEDIAARYRLATLHLRERKDPKSAEEEFLALRRRPLNAGTALLVSNHLIDIYRATDQRGRLMAELTRMMKEQAGTPMGEGAAKLLEAVRREG